MDGWDRARAARDRVLGVIRETPICNPVVLTGEVQKAIALDIKERLAGAHVTHAGR